MHRWGAMMGKRGRGPATKRTPCWQTLLADRSHGSKTRLGAAHALPPNGRPKHWLADGGGDIREPHDCRGHPHKTPATVPVALLNVKEQPLCTALL